MPRALVTGGAGFLGSFLAERLVREGYDVVVFDDLSKGKIDNLTNVKDRIEFVKGDITDQTAVSKVMVGVDIVFHYAALTGTELFYKEPRRMMEVNTFGTINILREAEREDVEKVIYASTSELYGYPLEVPTPENHPVQVMDTTNPRWSYSISKLFGEAYAFTSKLDILCLRYFNAYGPRMATSGYSLVIPELISKLLSSSPRLELIGNGDQTRSFCFVEDSVDATMIALKNFRNEYVNVGNDSNEITIRDLANKLMDISGIQKSITYLPGRKGDVPRRCPAIHKLRSVGWRPRIGLGTGLMRSIEWYRDKAVSKIPTKPTTA